ncbi:response regulator [Nocardioides perillae]|uniref:DNA-binding response OmpR family regulator n=1 Tax=Nocardioides perillae TaxID=1119534 RepID=A0A7Y9RUN6_9ACTN|nr:DNA-binding response OmpR family regulator [Nocardioides perillae]
MTTVLLVEDQEDIALPLQRMLQRDGYDVTWVDTGAGALEAIGARPDVVVLDLGLPDMDGLDVCRQARDGGFDGGIMIVTARSDELDRVVGLDYGADDYLAKPFGVAEMQARVRALARRAARSAPPAATGPADPGQPARAAQPAPPAAPATGLRVDRAARRVWVAAAEVALTTKEFDVLALLDTTRGAVVSREQLMAEVWDENWFGSTKTLDVTVGRLRQKLDKAHAPAQVVTVRGVGFRLEDDPARA